jgi:hypothetical protein
LDKIEATVIALDVSFRELLRGIAEEHPSLAMRLHDAYLSGSRNQSAGIPEAAAILGEYAAVLATNSKPASRH